MLSEFVKDCYRELAHQVAKPVLWGYSNLDDYHEDVRAWETDDWRIGPKHGPWLHQSMPEHLWPDNEWWWLPEEHDDECDC